MCCDVGWDRKCPVWLCLFAVLLEAGTAMAASVDLNGNSLSDIWEQTYSASALVPDDDPDHDGASNLLEAIAGTDPFDAQSCPRLSVRALSGAALQIAMPGAAGKAYELQFLQPLVEGGPTNWVAGSTVVLRSGTNVVFNEVASSSARFFRIAVRDLDTDGDNVSDWEEYRLGLDPENPASNGQLNSTGQPLTDYEYVTGRLAQQDLFTISTIDSAAYRPEPGQLAGNLGAVTVSRAGFPLRATTVNLGVGPGGPGVAIEGVDYSAIPRSIAFSPGDSSKSLNLVPLTNTNAITPKVATVNLASGIGYRIAAPSNAAVVIYPSPTPSGSGLAAQYFTNSSATYASTANFNSANLILNRTDPVVDFNWSNSPVLPFPNGGYYSIRWTGQVQPQYSELYYFVVNSDDGTRLWVNDQLIIDRWVLRSATDSIGTITLQAGVRYNLRLEYFNGGGSGVVRLSWYSASQPKQTIPRERLFATGANAAPSVVTSPLTAVAFVGQPFSYAVSGANSPAGFTASGLPPGLVFTAASGLIGGTPLQAGQFQVVLTASNSIGLGASVLNLQVLDTGSSIVREIWLGVPGTNVADIPITSVPTASGAWGALEGITDFGDAYGERVRGFFTAPVSGNYYFWLAASDSAELWISNDSEPCNKVRRAWVSASAPAGPRQWTAQPTQRSPWLALTAGQRYYLEVLHKAGIGAGDHWSVGWRQDSTGTNLIPAGLVPNHLLGRYYPQPPASIPGTLYTADMLAQGNAVSTGVGSATLRVSVDGSRAVLKFQANNLTSPITGEHIHSDPYLTHPSQIIFDIDSAPVEPDGSFLWEIGPVGTLSAADVLEIIREGKAYINLHTANYPNGEINGHFTLANGTQVFTPPPQAPAWPDDHSSSNAAARFLIQSTFGPSPADIAAVQSLGYEGWIDYQFSLPASYHLPYVLANQSADPTTPYPSSRIFNSWWQQSVTAPDQLRQRMAFALSQIMVVSDVGILQNNARAVSAYYDTLLTHAFGNFRELMEAVTLSPAMGLYLDMRQNDKGNIVTGSHPNENYAREILQLFSVGLNRLWPDGTLVMDSQGNLVPTYNQEVIMGFSSVFTGWNYYQTNQANGRLPTNFSPRSDYINPMVLVPTHHELGSKLLLDNVTLPPAWGNQASSSSVEFDAYCARDLELALDTIFLNENVGPFICRQLIQRLVTSHPSREYVYRVVQAFNDNGAGVRGDLRAVLKAILLDYEARSSYVSLQPTFGKQREPLLRATALARALPAPLPLSGTYTQAGTRTITVNTVSAHRLNTGDTVFLDLTDSSGQAPPTSQGYSVTVTSPARFTFNAPGLLSGTYTQSPNTSISNMVTGSTITTNVIQATISGHGLVPGNFLFLSFTSGGASNGQYQVIWTNGNNTAFAVTTADTRTNSLSGSSLLFRPTAGGYTQSGTTITVIFSGPHGLNPGEPVYLNFTTGTAVDGTYTVATVPDPKRFTVTTGTSTTQTRTGVSVYPLVPPPLNRSGQVVLTPSTWSVGSTDGSLTQTPLHSPTVFNFFFPDYRFQGPLAAAGLTTPEFQLTSDTEVAVQMNFLQGGLLNNTGNTNGLSSFVTGGGAVWLDLGPWMTPALTSNAGIPGLVDALASRLTGGQLAPAARSAIIAYVANTANFAYTTPTATQMRDRVRAVTHLLATSPDFTVQK